MFWRYSMINQITIQSRALTMFTALLLGCSSGLAQSSKDDWQNHNDLYQWISFPGGIPEEGVRGIERLTEGDLEFIRVDWNQINTAPFFMNPNEFGFSFTDPSGLATLIDPTVHDGIRVTLRHNMPLRSITGRWGHRNGKYDESLATMPKFEYCEVPSDSEWHQVTLKLTDSPFFDPSDDVVFVMFAIADSSLSREEIAERYEALPEGTFLDIAHIELVSLGEPILQPQITDFSPKRGFGGTLVTIVGSGFAEPASRNVVLFDSVPAEVVSGTSASIDVMSPAGEQASIKVLTPGGGKAVAAEDFIFIRNPYDIVISSGDNQSGQVGDSLAPFVVKMVGVSGEGLHGVTVSFDIVSGDGSLSASEAVTDENGLASTVLTFGSTPGEVRVEAKWSTFQPVLFTAKAIP
jgi:hypothetical protein